MYYVVLIFKSCLTCYHMLCLRPEQSKDMTIKCCPKRSKIKFTAVFQLQVNIDIHLD